MGKLSEQQKAEIRNRYAAGGVTIRQLADDYKVGSTTISRILYPKYAKEEIAKRNTPENKTKEKIYFQEYKSNRKRYKFVFNNEKDAEILEKINNVENKTSYFGELIRRDLEVNKNG